MGLELCWKELTFYQTKNVDLSKFKAFANNKLNVTQKFSVKERQKTLQEKKKMLVISVFSFSNNVFKRPFSKGHENKVLSSKTLNVFRK